jgi:hypothetical protein
MCSLYTERGNETTVIDDRNVATAEEARSFRGRDFGTTKTSTMSSLENTLGSKMSEKIQLVVCFEKSDIKVEVKKKGVWYIQEAFKRGRRYEIRFDLESSGKKNPVVKMVVACRNVMLSQSSV